jgi:sugar phosphate isomerase/epimerase
MNLLLHTIALEPARWNPRRVSRPLTDILTPIAAAGFHDLEIYEPHLGVETASSEIRDAFERLKLLPIILSSYLNLNPTETSDAALDDGILRLAERIAFYRFQKVRLFPGSGVKPSDQWATDAFMARLDCLLQRIPPVEILLETHDGSIADDPALLVRLMDRLPSNVGLLYQPTIFTPQAALDQFRLQKPFIRHLHLQNRNPDFSFATLAEGVIPWPEIIAEMKDKADATIEFVPLGIRPEEFFDFKATLRQAREETDYVRSLI